MVLIIKGSGDPGNLDHTISNIVIPNTFLGITGTQEPSPGGSVIYNVEFQTVSAIKKVDRI